MTTRAAKFKNVKLVKPQEWTKKETKQPRKRDEMEEAFARPIMRVDVETGRVMVDRLREIG